MSTPERTYESACALSESDRDTDLRAALTELHRLGERSRAAADGPGSLGRRGNRKNVIPPAQEVVQASFALVRKQHDGP